MPLPMLMRQLGHADISTTMIYAEFDPEYNDMERFFDRVADRFGFGDACNTPGNTTEGAGA